MNGAGAPPDPNGAGAPRDTPNAYAVNYDVASINAEPVDMQSVASELDEMQKSVADDLLAIDNRLKSLRLSWAGDSAKEREEITDSWIIVMLELFGAPHAAEQGVLPALTGGVLNAAKNLSSAELGVAKAFRKFSHNLQSDDHTDRYQAPPDELNPRITAITSDYPLYY